MKRKILAGQTSVSMPVFIQDTSSTTGGGLSGVTSSSSGLVLEYRRRGQASWTSVTPVSKTLGTYTSGGIVADGSLSGAYEVDFPDAAFASGARWVVCRIRGVANMLPVLIEVELDAVDYQTDAFGALKPTTAGRTLDVTATGAAGIDLGNVENQGSTLNLSATSIKTATDVETDTQDIQTRLPSGLVDGRMASIAEVVGDKTGYKLASDGLSLVTAWAVGITGNITGNVTGSVGSISGVTFPTHFDNLAIAPNGHVTSTVDSINNNAITASSIQANAITSAKIASGAITSAAFANDSITALALATDAVNEIANAVAALQVLIRLDSMIESDGAGQFRFDTIAVSLASQGGGGGAVNISVEDQSITVC